MTLFRSLSLATLIAASAALPVATAHAEPAKSVSVTYADLNLTSEGGHAVLQRRIDQAAKLSCGGEPTAAIRLQRAYQDCIKTAKSGAAQHVQTAIAAANKETSVAQATN